MRDELLHDFGERLEDAVIVDGCQVEAQMDVKANILKVIGGSLVNVSLRFHLEVVGHAVHLMDEHLELDARVHFVRLRHRLVQLAERLKVIVLSIDDEHERSAIAENHVGIEGRIEEIDLSGKVPDLELHEAGRTKKPVGLKVGGEI